MKKGFAVTGDLISMPLTYLGKTPQEWIAVEMLRGINAFEQHESHPHFMSCSVFPIYYFFAFVSSLFQIDTNKSITQKRLKKVSEPVTI